ncbi:hypothetical protein GCM10028821_47280 [Hymenobacter jeollabukensis]
MWQPWATLAALRAKRYETRSWYTDYRGPLALHATASTPAAVLAACAADPHIMAALQAAGLSLATLPQGAIVAITTLGEVAQIQEHPQAYAGAVLDPAQLTPAQRAYGDYRHGRFAWTLDDTQALSIPVPCAGRQRIWHLPPAVQQQQLAILTR